MKNLKYLNGVLTVIAVCLVLLTLSVIGVIPKASASAPVKFAAVPVNSDGSINVRFEQDEPVVVDIQKIGGQNIKNDYLQNHTPIPLPVRVIPN